MALKYFQLNKSQMEDLIISETFEKTKSEVEEMLNIQNIKYEIETKEVATDKDCYPEQYTNARLSFKNSYSEIDKMSFYTETIKESINSKFLRLSINESMFFRVIDIFIKATLIHELIHIQQFQQGRLNKDIMEEEKTLLYKDRPLEIEANEKAKNIISSYGEFESKIAEYIYSDCSVEEKSLTEIIELYLK